MARLYCISTLLAYDYLEFRQMGAIAKSTSSSFSLFGIGKGADTIVTMSIFRKESISSHELHIIHCSKIFAFADILEFLDFLG